MSVLTVHCQRRTSRGRDSSDRTLLALQSRYVRITIFTTALQVYVSQLKLIQFSASRVSRAIRYVIQRRLHRIVQRRRIYTCASVTLPCNQPATSGRFFKVTAFNASASSRARSFSNSAAAAAAATHRATKCVARLHAYSCCFSAASTGH
jgi:hypothetical protein